MAKRFLVKIEFSGKFGGGQVKTGCLITTASKLTGGNFQGAFLCVEWRLCTISELEHQYYSDRQIGKYSRVDSQPTPG